MNRRELVLLLGCAVAAPHAPSAQQKAMPVIGVLNITSAQRNPNSPFWAAFRQGLGETGYVEGQNVAFEFRSAEWHYDRLALLAADLVGRKVDVIVALNVSALAAKNATSTIPIVFAVGSDPVVDGLVASLARPGGNLRGFTSFNLELMPKRLELLSDLAPQARVIALLVDPNISFITEPTIRDMQDAARARGLQLPILKASTESEIDAAFATLVRLQVGGLFVGPSTFFFAQREQIFALA